MQKGRPRQQGALFQSASPFRVTQLPKVATRPLTLVPSKVKVAMPTSSLPSVCTSSSNVFSSRPQPLGGARPIEPMAADAKQAVQADGTAKALAAAFVGIAGGAVLEGQGEAA